MFLLARKKNAIYNETGIPQTAWLAAEAKGISTRRMLYVRLSLPEQRTGRTRAPSRSFPVGNLWKAEAVFLRAAGVWNPLKEETEQKHGV
jgi:hypothetical protein